MGYQALGKNTSGGSNVAIGRSALFNVTTSSSNTAIGNSAGYNVTSGGNGVYIGNSAGSSASAKALGNDNIYIGANSKPSADGVSNEIVIGRNALGLGSNSVNLGHTTISSVYFAGGTVTSISSTSDLRDKKNVQNLNNGLDIIMKLRPVLFDWNMRDGSKIDVPSSGFIAQELLSVQNSTNISEYLRLADDSDPDRLKATYGNLIPLLTKAIQEQQDLIEALQARLETLEANQ